MMIRKMLAATVLALGAASTVALAPTASAAPAALVFAGVYPSLPVCLDAGAVGKSQKRWSYYHCVLLVGNQGGLWVQ